jgi:predicted RecA/RadA family phage recombinase
MTTTFIENGASMTVTLAGTVSSGGVAELADCIGVYATDGVSGDQVTVHMDGVHKLAKETGVAFTAGDMLYWDATNDNLDKTDTNIPAGICWADAASGDTTALVHIGRTG